MTPPYKGSDRPPHRKEIKKKNPIIARNYKFENKELTKATTAIAKATESATKSLLKIASVMAEVEARALYADDFKSIAEFGERVCG